MITWLFICAVGWIVLGVAVLLGRLMVRFF
jgi:hypothetical protein